MTPDNLFLDDANWERWVEASRRLGDAIKGLIARKVLGPEELIEFHQAAIAAMERNIANHS